MLCCLSDVLEGSSFIAVWSVSYFVMLLKNFVGVIYQSLRKVCATSGPCTSTRTCFVLNGSRCLIELLVAIALWSQKKRTESWCSLAIKPVELYN